MANKKVTKRRKFDMSCYNKAIDSGRSPKDAMTLCDIQKQFVNVKGYKKKKGGPAKPKSDDIKLKIYKKI